VLDSSKIEGIEIDDLEDWFGVSNILSNSGAEKLGEFEIDGDSVEIHLSSDFKCPRCWKQKAKKEDELCPRCKKVLDA